MQITHMRVMAVAVWAAALGAAGLLGNAASPSSWIVLAGCAILPPLVIMRYWHDPQPTLSQSIQRELR